MISVQFLTSSRVSYVLIAPWLKQLVESLFGQNGPLPMDAILGIQVILALEYAIYKA